MTFKELRQKTGMNMTRFAEYFGMAFRTVQNWDNGSRNCQPHLLELMKYKLEKEGILPGGCDYCKRDIKWYCDIENLGEPMESWTASEVYYCPKCGRKVSNE